MADETKTTTDGQAAGGTTTAAATTDEPKVKKDIVPAEYRKRYAELGGNCGDFIAAELSSMVESGGIDSLNSVKTENDIPTSRWGGLNNGQQRMNLSNILRANFLRGQTIKIAGKAFNIEQMRDEFGKLDPTDEKSQAKFLDFVGMPNTDRNRAAIKRHFHDLPEKGRLRAEREEAAAKAKQEKADKAAAAKAEKETKAAAAKTDGAATAKKSGGKGGAAKTTAAKQTEPA